MTLEKYVSPAFGKMGAGLKDVAKVSVRPQCELELGKSPEEITEGEMHAADDEDVEPPRRRRRGDSIVERRGRFEEAKVDEDEVPESVRAALYGKDARCGAAAGGAASSKENVVMEDKGEENVDWEVDFEGDHSEAKKIKIQTPVVKPSAEQIRRHNITHCPYRSWCECCVQGAANMDGHVKRREPIGDPNELHSDYCFFKDKKNDRVNTATGLVTVDRKSGGVCAHVCPKKGAGGGWIVKQYVRDIKKFGYQSKVILRSDGEPAIKDLLSKVGEMRGAETILEQARKEDSKANGRPERAIQSVEKQTRVLKISTENSLGSGFSVDHPCFTLLVMHAADALTK